ncbi:MAG: ATP-dependent DNA helicase RecG [Candidatus Azambacteria bacterium GW2011_GWA1_42_19]|uniref:ATP-dependent DNA helicase RecG n=1 Tax=Candidatus Azambacteria bacterium GW2011_GWA1_42_19 TaxID=1618609 RepID=A0A0G1BFK5_9BACT|nr:MAG: ATP-dependent DNA helicase RecG [Candidatus Azambacteria bacterium GW2011_GWA1_42_19]
MAKFRAGEYHILVSTPVVEVGIDIPTATIMVIEGADRFGLAQLHQLRGRVGRSDAQSYCLLFADTISERLKAMETHHSGFELAEIDLRLRGSGNIYGTSQHGLPNFKIATYQDFTLIPEAKKQAELLLPNLSKYPFLKELLEKDKIIAA